VYEGDCNECWRKSYYAMLNQKNEKKERQLGLDAGVPTYHYTVSGQGATSTNATISWGAAFEAAAHQEPKEKPMPQEIPDNQRLTIRIDTVSNGYVVKMNLNNSFAPTKLAFGDFASVRECVLNEMTRDLTGKGAFA